MSKPTPIRLLYIARMSVRKGVEMIVDLSHRLDDLQGLVQIEAIGGRTLWSDYTGHLRELNPNIAIYSGELKNDVVRDRMLHSEGLLLPSHYEPGGLVVGEALSAGLPVVVSEEVGSGEPVDASVCRRFPAGNADLFEKAVRQLIADVRVDRQKLADQAQSEARRHFSVDGVAGKLHDILATAIHERQAATRPLPASLTGISSA